MTLRTRFWIPALLLAFVGLLNVYSASMPLAMAKYGDPAYFFKRQLFWLLIAVFTFVITMQVPLETWRRYSAWLFFGLVAFLVAMHFSGLAAVRNGAARWVALGPFVAQPSELAKPLLAVYLAKALSSSLFVSGKARSDHYASVLAFSGTLVLVIAFQPDFGGAVLLGGMLVVLLFSAGAPWRLLGGLALVGLVLGRLAIVGSSYRMGRVMAFLDPWSDDKQFGFQLIQSFLALGNGGWTGRGLGLGTQKLFYLPEAHTDFVFSVIGEEWGFIGALFVLGIICWLLWELLQVVLRAEGQPFARYAALGVFFSLAIAYAFNLSVATGLLPTKGLALPLVSYGGSALLASAVSLGIVARVDQELAA